MKVTALLVVTGSMLFSASMFAGTCEINFTRTACPGKETISFKKCGGKASCTEFQDVANASLCKTAAIAACANDRLTVTKLKVITAKFDGADLKTDTGSTDFCTAYPKAADEFNKC